LSNALLQVSERCDSPSREVDLCIGGEFGKVRPFLKPSTGGADPRGHETGFVAGQAKQQVPPLRFAPVGMTILLENWRYRAKFLFHVS
jgi:hypothetical protein